MGWFKCGSSKDTPLFLLANVPRTGNLCEGYSLRVINQDLVISNETLCRQLHRASLTLSVEDYNGLRTLYHLVRSRKVGVPFRVSAGALVSYLNAVYTSTNFNDPLARIFSHIPIG